MKFVASILVIAGLGTGQVQDEILGDTKSGRSLFEVRIVPKSDFTLAGITERGRHFLENAGGRDNLALLSMYSDRAVAAKEAQACEGGYHQWRRYYDDFPKSGWGAAAIISLKGDSALLFRAPGGGVVHQVLTGKDPTLFSLDAARFEVLDIMLKGASRIPICGAPGTVDPVVYLKTNAKLTPELCTRVTASLAKNLATQHIWVSIRNDTWFQCAPFPIVYPFSTGGLPPSEGAHQEVPEFTCMISCDGTPHCTQTSGKIR
jgi:hypothetical protein